MGDQVLPPGYRFSPTDEELMVHYLWPNASGRAFPQGPIAVVDVYKFEPWDLPEKSCLSSKDSEWYFLSSQDKKNSHNGRINRTTRKGYWKATGKDRKVHSGWKKTLIYYEGRAPKGSRTDWVMHEYRLDEESEKEKTGVSVLCRIRNKGGAGPRNGEQYGVENGETGEGVNLQNVDVGPDTGCIDVVKSEDGGNVFDLQTQVEFWKRPDQMDLSEGSSDRTGTGGVSARKLAGSPKVASDCTGGDMHPTNESEPHRNNVSQSSSDTTHLDMATNFCDRNGEGVNLQNVDVGPDTCVDVVKSEDGGNVFYHQKESEDQKLPGQMDLSEVTLDHIGNEDMSVSKIVGSPEVASDCIGVGGVCATNESVPHRNDVFQSSSDMLCLDMASNLCDCNADIFPCPHEYMAMQSAGVFDLDTFPPLPTLLDVDGQDIALPPFDESEMWEVVSDGQGELSSTGANENVMLQAVCNVSLGGDGHLVGGNFIELDDMKAPLDGFAPRSPSHSSECGWPEEQQLQGLAARRGRLQIPVFKGGLQEAGVSQHHKAAHTLLPEVETQIHGGSSDVNIPIAARSNESINRNFTGSYSGSGLNSWDAHHVMASSSRSFLSKHVATYGVSKCQMVPAQLYYASLTESQDGITTASDTISSSSSVTVGDESEVDTDALEDITAIQKTSSLSWGSQTETSNPEGRSPDVEDPLLQGCNRKAVNATGTISLIRHSSWRQPLRGLVNKAKQSTLGTLLLQLEGSVRAKFNDKLSALGKAAVRFLPTEGNTTNPYDILRKMVVASLCHLAAAVLIFFCLFWGVRIL